MIAELADAHDRPSPVGHDRIHARMNDRIEARPYNQRRRLRIIQILALALLPFIIMSYPIWPAGSAVYEAFELIGMTLLLVCIFGRLWSILYSGSKKNVALVTRGPYSVTRNPLYLFSSIGAVGIGFLFGSIMLAFLLGGATSFVLCSTARGEMHYLRAKFGAAYDEYAARTPFFLPNLALYREINNPTFDPSALKRTFRDALYFLLAIPALEVAEYLRHSGLMPDIFPVF